MNKIELIIIFPLLCHLIISLVNLFLRFLIFFTPHLLFLVYQFEITLTIYLDLKFPFIYSIRLPILNVFSEFHSKLDQTLTSNL